MIGATPAPAMRGARVWIAGARPRTLLVSVSPVLVGAATAGVAAPLRTLGCLGVGLGLQVGVNYANDYFDGVRGVDTGRRAGPLRITASGLASPRAVAMAAALSVAVGGACGLALALTSSPWLLVAGVAAVLALVLYSGGPKPYASLGLGEVFVFVFFGLVATCGTAFVAADRIPAGAWWGGASMGLCAVGVLLANNLRDIPTDSATGKRTLAVRIGDRATRVLLAALVLGAPLLVAGAVLAGAYPVRALGSLVACAALVGVMARVPRARGRELVPVLVGIGRFELLLAVLLALLVWPW